MRTFLVAIVAPAEQDVHDFLLASPLGPDSADSAVDCWWIAEDDGTDGSDNDSAIFVPRGSQSDMSRVLDNYDIIRRAAFNYLHGFDDFTDEDMRRLADALGVNRGDVEALGGRS